eukprot:3237098-Prymnesium_polylepis.2
MAPAYPAPAEMPVSIMVISHGLRGRSRPGLLHGSFGRPRPRLSPTRYPLGASTSACPFIAPAMPSNNRNTDSSEQSTPSLSPDRDGDLKTRAPWLLKLGKRLKHHDARFETQVKYCYHFDKGSGKTITRSTAHSKLIYNGALKPGTYAAPFNPAAPVLLPGATSDDVPAEIAPQYVANLGRCNQIDSAILACIVSTIISDKKGEDLEEKSGGSEVEALAQLHAYKPISEIKTWADGELAAVR